MLVSAGPGLSILI